MKIVSGVTRSALALLMSWSMAASAYTLSFNPASQNVSLGSKAYVEVGITGVLPGGLGNYDFDVLFDPAILAFDQAIDRYRLGVAIGLGASPDTGKVTLSDFSLESPADLLALQTDGFPLLTLVFDTLAVGISALSFDVVTLGDVDGVPVLFDAGARGAITVAAAQVPAPGTLALALAGMLAVMAIRQRAGR